MLLNINYDTKISKLYEYFYLYLRNAKFVGTENDVVNLFPTRIAPVSEFFFLVIARLLLLCNFSSLVLFRTPTSSNILGSDDAARKNFIEAFKLKSF